MKIFFNGWFSGFLDKTNPGVSVDFFIKLFENVYNESCEIGELNESDILCEFDMLLDCPGTLVNYKQWRHKYLFNGESIMRQNTNDYDIVLWGERNYGNVINVPLFIPYLYTNNFVDKLTEPKNISNVPENEVCVIITNPGGHIRNYFLDKLDENFKVIYAGSYKNNTGGNIPYPYNSIEFNQFIGKFKFVISMENSKNDTYITEKIIHGLLANTIPVYWGSSRVFDYFNPNRILNLENENTIDNIINKMKELNENKDEWLKMVNQTNFKNDQLERTMEAIAKDIRCIINKGCWNHISKVYCVNNPEFEPERHTMLKTMFNELNINDDYIKYVSPTYKTTITKEIYDKYTSNQLVKYLREQNLSYGELSLFLNYRAILEDIEKNYEDGLFLIFESDVLKGQCIDNLNEFMSFIKNINFDAIHLGCYSNDAFSNPLEQLNTGYRLGNYNEKFVNYVNSIKNNEIYIEDITNKDDKFRIIRKFTTKCTDTFLWSYQGIIKFLNFMRNFEDYSSPFDYYMCNFFELDLTFKHYWSVTEFFIQGSNLGLLKSTIQN